MKQIFFYCFFIACLVNKPLKNFAQSPLYVLEKKIAIPGNGGYDYLFLDQQNRRLYVSHGTTVNVIDLKTEQLAGAIENMEGVHGIAIANKVNRGFISDGRANAVVVFDIKTLERIVTIPITGKGPDGIIYDPFSDKVFAFNGRSNDASVIDVKKLKQVHSVDLGGAPEFAVADGKGKIYNNLEDKNSLDVIDTHDFKVVQNYPLAPCGGPTGIALDAADGIIFTVCRENKGMSVVDISSGKVLTTLPIGGGVDAVVYDPSDKMVFASNGDGTASIYKQDAPDKYELLQTLNTQQRAKTMAFDPVTRKLYFSVADYEPGTRNMLPNSFKVLVYKLQ